MKTIDNELYKNRIEHHSITLGELIFFENFFIIELNEGVTVSYKNFIEAKILIDDFFADREFGGITNRLNSYALALGDYESFNAAFENLKAFAVVSYNHLSNKIYELESEFCYYNRKNFNTISDAAAWVNGFFEFEEVFV